MAKAKKKERKTITVKTKYKGEKSKKGNYFPYNIQPNDAGIVGTIYYPKDMIGNFPVVIAEPPNLDKNEEED